MNGKTFRLLVKAITCGLAMIPALLDQAAMAQQIVVIGNDRGGYVGERARIVDGLRAAHTRVEIRGDICYSSCTMYLGVGDVCIRPETVFGFHGPSRNGVPLDPSDLDHWSRVMARYYSEPLRQWYMSTARYESRGVLEIRGSDLIGYGYSSC